MGPGHPRLLDLVRQRPLQIGCDADQDDATWLRTDPLLKLMSGGLPESGTDRATGAPPELVVSPL